MPEIWKELEGFSKYKFSNTGKIWSKCRNKEMLLDLKQSGYARIRLYNDDKEKYKTLSVHRLIALTFIPNPENKPTVNHTNHNRADNRVENLEWATMAEQNNNKKEASKEVISKRLNNSRAVWRCSLDGKKLEYYKTLCDAEDWVFENKGSKKANCNISAVCLNKRNTAYGFKWIHDTSEEKIFENEIWKNIPKELIKGYTGYKISNYGRIKKIKNNQFLRGHLHISGYKCVGIGSASGDGATYQIHRLVAQVFLPNYYGKSFVNHKDHNRANCKLYNIEWVTPQENSKLAYQYHSSEK